MTEWTGQWHPFAERFPMLSEQELRDMAESIKETGQLHPCVMNPDGLGLDGRNRVAACRIAGVQPVWTVNGGNPMSIIIAANVHHRSLSTGQRAMAVALDLHDKGMRSGGRWKRGAIPENDSRDVPEKHSGDDTGKVSGTAWQRAMSQAGFILDYAANLADAVLDGSTAVETAYQRAKEAKERADRAVDAETRRTERIEALPEDLAALVESGVRGLDDAEAESLARIAVIDVDKTRDGDGTPPPSFADRVESGALTWVEARKLAEEWERERAESIQRDQERLVKVTDGWAALRDIAANPTNPYALAVLEELPTPRREAVQKIIDELNGEAA